MPSVPPSAAATRRLARGALRAASLYLGVGGALVVLFVYLSATQENFATWTNVKIILETNAVLLVVSVGLTFVLLVGGLDLSMGGMLALSGVVFGELLVGGVPAAVAILIVVVGAAAVGAATNGFLIAKVGLSFLVVTLGTAGVFAAAALLRTNGQTETLFEPGLFQTIGSGDVAGVSWLIVISLAILLLGILVLRYTGFGRMIYAVGGNPDAARLAGIDVAMVRLSVYAIAACLAGVAGFMEAARLSSANPNAGQLIVLEAAAAVLLGGASFMGGSGTLLGTFLGVFFLGVLSNGITRLEVSSYWNGVITGCVLIFALLLDRLRATR